MSNTFDKLINSKTEKLLKFSLLKFQTKSKILHFYL